jgi:O-glycosyl hydrolase
MSVRCFAGVVFCFLRGPDDGAALGRSGMGRWGLAPVWVAAISLFLGGRACAALTCGLGVDVADALVACGSGSSVASPYVPCLPGGGGDLRTDAKSPLVVTIDTSQRGQTIRSFGASDAWSIQFVGQWPAARREAIADLLFATGLDEHKNPKGIGLSSWRFNLGAGSSRQNNISDAWRRADTFLNASFSGYDWSRCPGQRWFLGAAKARGVERFIAFVNSPPTNMTKNGLAFCTADSGSSNLWDDRAGDFSTYLAAILKHFRDAEGIEFEGVSPFNEPNWDWDNAGQEGCRYANFDIYRVVLALYQQLQTQQLDTQIEICEAGDISYLYGGSGQRGDYIDAFFNPGGVYYVGNKAVNRISGHSYYTCWPEEGRLVDWRRTLRAKLDEYPGLEYAMSEYCILVPSDSWVPARHRGYGGGRNLGIDPALWVARVIHYDLTMAEACEWQWWLAVSPYDYKDGLVYIDKRESDGGYYESKMLWAMGNFSRFIRPGMVRVAVRRSDNAMPAATVEDLMISAYRKADDGTVVVVFVNWAGQNRPVKLDFLGAGIRSVIPYVTKGDSQSQDNLTAYGAVSPDDTLAIPARSVVTLVGTATNLGDWDKNARVDFRDYAILADRWSAAPGGKGSVGFRDLADLAEHWLTDFRLVAHWRLDEISGTAARDDAGNKHGLLRGKPIWQPAGGMVKGALRLDGIDDCVETPLVLDPAGERFSVFAWVKGGGPGQVILSQEDGTDWLLAAPDGTLRTDLKQAGRSGKPLGSTTVITDGAWHEVGLTWDGASRILYVDGAAVARDAQESLLGSTGSLSLGVGSTMTGGFWKGLLDDARIYDRTIKP